MAPEQSDPTEQSVVAAPDSDADDSPKYVTSRRRSKIGRLPKPVRDKLNFMMLDGLPYHEILQTLGDDAKAITENNLTRWSNTGYKDWLHHFQRLEEVRVQQEVAMDMACPDGGSKIHEATLQLAATKLAEMVRNLDCSDFKDLLRDDPAKLTPFLTALATISNAELRCERHRLELEERLAALRQSTAPQSAPGLKPQTRHKLEKELNLM